jgi:hypothetical protein
MQRGQGQEAAAGAGAGEAACDTPPGASGTTAQLHCLSEVFVGSVGYISLVIVYLSLLLTANKAGSYGDKQRHCDLGFGRASWGMIEY